MEQLSPGQIKKYLKQLKQREEQYIYYLGQLAFQAGENGQLQDKAMLEAYQVLKDIQAQTAQYEAALEQIKAAREAAQRPQCPACGGAVVKGAVYCPHCGAAIAAPPPAAAVPPSAAPAAPVGPSCPGCGAPLDADAVFCGNCGARVTPAAPVPPAPVAPPAEAPGEAPAAPAASSGAAGVEAHQQAEEAMPPLEETLACPGCGAAIGEKDMRFCPSCGTKVRE